jgi:hypothetical protein
MLPPTPHEIGLVVLGLFIGIAATVFAAWLTQ